MYKEYKEYIIKSGHCKDCTNILNIRILSDVYNSKIYIITCFHCGKQEECKTSHLNCGFYAKTKEIALSEIRKKKIKSIL